MAILVDTSILVRLANQADINHGKAQSAMYKLHGRGEVLHITAQNLVEFRNVSTRPIKDNGLGMSSTQSGMLSKTFEASFPLLVETPDIFPIWRSLVDNHNIIGKQVHDARLIAICHLYQISHVLTFNVAHFTRLSSVPPGIIVLDPARL